MLFDFSGARESEDEGAFVRHCPYENSFANSEKIVLRH